MSKGNALIYDFHTRLQERFPTRDKIPTNRN